MPPSRLTKHTHKLATECCTCFSTLTFFFSFYDIALELQRRCDLLTNGCGGPAISIRPTLLPCCTAGKMHQRLLPETIYCQDSICRLNMWWLSRPWRSQEKKRHSDRELKINLCTLITKKNKTNSTQTHQWRLSLELECSLHYNILITANKDPEFIDSLPDKKTECMGAMNCSYKQMYSETAALAYKIK